MEYLLMTCLDFNVLANGISQFEFDMNDSWKAN